MFNTQAMDTALKGVAESRCARNPACATMDASTTGEPTARTLKYAVLRGMSSGTQPVSWTTRRPKATLVWKSTATSASSHDRRDASSAATRNDLAGAQFDFHTATNAATARPQRPRRSRRFNVSVAAFLLSLANAATTDRRGGVEEEEPVVHEVETAKAGPSDANSKVEQDRPQTSASNMLISGSARTVDSAGAAKTRTSLRLPFQVLLLC